MREFQRRRGRAFFLLLTLPATAMGFALAVQISAMSWILATRYDLDIHEIGLVWAAGPVAGILGQVVVGIASDRLWVWNGRRRVFILVGAVVAALMLLTLPEIGAISAALGLDSVIGVAIVVALALDLAVNVGFNPTRALIADVTGEGAERSRGYSWMQAVSGSFGVLAYAIGALFGNMALLYAGAALVLAFAIAPALLIEEPRPEPIAEAAANRASFATIASALSPLWAILAYDLHAVATRLGGSVPAGHAAEALCAGATLLLMAHALADRRHPLAPFRMIVAAHALSWLGIQSLFIYLIPFLQDRMPDLDAGALGRIAALAFLALNIVAAGAPSLLLAPLARKRRRVRVHAAALGVTALAFLAAWIFAHQPVTLYAAMAVAGIGWGAMVSLPFAIMTERVDARRTGLFMGMFNLAVVLPQLVASFGIGTLLAGAEDKGMLFLLGAGFFALSAGAWLLVPARPAASAESANG